MIVIPINCHFVSNIFNLFSFQITDICQVTPQAEENVKDSSVDDNSKFISNGISKFISNGISNGISKNLMDENKSDNPNELICLDEAEAAAEQLDGFTLDDLNDEVSTF